MATPTRSQTVSTPKPHLSTPNRLMASPRPGTANAANRPLSHKSPAVKTPASVHGHTHQVSVSSQPSGTPMTATAIHDDILALNSPAAALIASLGSTGLTPLGGGGDGLGISTAGQGTSGRAGIAPANPEADRIQRAHLVADLLKTRAAGRGITRDGVEKIAQLQGFNTLWDDDNLTIAGNAVDLEVNFDSLGRDAVKDVSLKLSTSESEELQLQESATNILKHNLSVPSSPNNVSQWASLELFETNLQYLSHLDQIEGGAPCFNAVNGLYHAFKQIWDAEKQRLNWRANQSHLKRGAVGRPLIDQNHKLGVSLDYWLRRQDPEAPGNGDDGDATVTAKDLYTARILCESGAPSSILMNNWVSDQVLSVQTQAESILQADGDTLRPDWGEPGSNLESSNEASKTDSDDIIMERAADSLPAVVNMHFIGSLLPEVYLPLNVAAGLNTDITMIDMNQEMTVTYQKALQQRLNRGRPDVSKDKSEERWSRALPVSDNTHDHSLRRHSYALHSAQNGAPLWCYPVRSLKFTHPRQLAAAFPVLRQYVLVWSILLSLVDFAVDEGHDEDSNHLANAKGLKIPGRALKRSNAKSGGYKFEELLRGNGSIAQNEPLPVDVSLDVISDPSKARIDIFVPIRGALSRGRQKPFMFISFAICIGGTIELRSLDGVHANDANDLDVRSKVSRILTATEDIGILIEWLLKEVAAQV